ncbi:MAG TPA: DUF1579 domain-containing protein, partial [Bacteroidota bacterium]|nr:DUF1579 domain-containing protein [Bacteroidota bacterium]
MRRSLVLVSALFFALFLFNTSGIADQKKSAKKKPSQEEVAKRWEQFITPGEGHKFLEQLVGTWSCEVKMWMDGPQGKPIVSKGTGEYKMALGGRFLQQEFTGEVAGQPFHGVGYIGFDNFKKTYVSFWIDDMTTAMMTMEGSLDSKATALTMHGKVNEPATGERNITVKDVLRIVDKDTHVFETYNVTTFGEKKPV